MTATTRERSSIQRRTSSPGDVIELADGREALHETIAVVASEPYRR